jgi:hypothetical protein
MLATGKLREGGVLHVDMLAHNKSSTAYQAESRRLETVFVTLVKGNPTGSRGCHPTDAAPRHLACWQPQSMQTQHR